MQQQKNAERKWAKQMPKLISMDFCHTHFAHVYPYELFLICQYTYRNQFSFISVSSNEFQHDYQTIYERAEELSLFRYFFSSFISSLPFFPLVLKCNFEISDGDRKIDFMLNTHTHTIKHTRGPIIIQQFIADVIMSYGIIWWRYIVLRLCVCALFFLNTYTHSYCVQLKMQRGQKWMFYNFRLIALLY